MRVKLVPREGPLEISSASKKVRGHMCDLNTMLKSPPYSGVVAVLEGGTECGNVLCTLDSTRT
jgi:hypothetical protein